MKLGGAHAPEGLGPAQSANVERAIDEAFVSGYRVVMLVAVAIALASALSAAHLLEGKKPEGNAERTIAEEDVGANPLEP